MTPMGNYTGPDASDAGAQPCDGTLRTTSSQVEVPTAEMAAAALDPHPAPVPPPPSGTVGTVGIDATPLLGPRTGIGTYVHRLLTGLAGNPDVDPVATPFTVRGRAAPDDLPSGVRWAHLPVPARIARWSWRQGLPLPVEMFAGKVQVFHGTNFVLPALRKAAGVLTVHDLTYLRHPDWVDAASRQLIDLVPRGLRRAGAVATPSRSVADELADAYPHIADRLVVTPLGVEDAWFEVDPTPPDELAALGLPAEYVLAVGTLEPRKGLDVLVKAHAAARAAEPSVPPLVLVGGSGWGTLPVTGSDVILPGYLDRATLRGVVAAASAFAFPSRYEGFGLPPLEALAAGVPVVASDLPVTREVLGRHARYAPVGDVDALADALLTTLHSPPSAAERQTGQDHARRCTWDRCVTATMDAYRLALAAQ